MYIILFVCVCLHAAEKNSIKLLDNISALYTFDKIFSPASSQEDVYYCISPLLHAALKRNNICLLLYGPTGTGKTFTLGLHIPACTPQGVCTPQAVCTPQSLSSYQGVSTPQAACTPQRVSIMQAACTPQRSKDILQGVCTPQRVSTPRHAAADTPQGVCTPKGAADTPQAACTPQSEGILPRLFRDLFCLLKEKELNERNNKHTIQVHRKP